MASRARRRSGPGQRHEVDDPGFGDVSGRAREGVRTELVAKASTIADRIDGQVTSLRTDTTAANHNAQRADRDKDPPPPDFSDQGSVRAHAEAMIERRFEAHRANPQYQDAQGGREADADMKRRGAYRGDDQFSEDATTAKDAPPSTAPRPWS